MADAGGRTAGRVDHDLDLGRRDHGRRVVGDARRAAAARLGDRPCRVPLRGPAHACERRLRALRREIRDRWADFFTRFDALLCPVYQVPACPHQVDDDPIGVLNRTVDVAGTTVSHGELTYWCGLIGMAYLPAVVVPVGHTPEGLPVGIQLVADFENARTALVVVRRIGDILGGFPPPPRFGA